MGINGVHGIGFLSILRRFGIIFEDWGTWGGWKADLIAQFHSFIIVDSLDSIDSLLQLSNQIIFGLHLFIVSLLLIFYH